MRLSARLEESTLQQILGELLPLTVLLDKPGDDGLYPQDGQGGEDGGQWVRIDPAQKVDFIAGQGLHLVTAGALRWNVAGVPIEATLHTAEVMLRPGVVAEKHGGKLVFRPSILSADVKNLPGFVDRTIVGIVNRRLEASADQLVWDFGRTLDFAVPLPSLLVGVSRLELDVTNAVVQVLADAITFDVNLAIHFQRTPGLKTS